jgi:DNA-binding transcriptional ArsR family regulator
VRGDSPRGTALRVSDESALGTRVVVSPLLTLATALMDAYGAAQASPWSALLRDRARGLDPGPLAVFGLPTGYLPNGMLPLPRTSFASFDAELAALRATPAEPILLDLAECTRWHGLTPQLAGLQSDPHGWMQSYCAALELHWTRLLAPSWPRIRRLLEREVLLVGRTLAGGGLPETLGTLHPAVGYRDGCVHYETGVTTKRSYLAEKALTLMPLATDRDLIVANEDHPEATILAYPARGSAELWEDVPRAGGELALLLGETRATIARALELPATTLDLATRLRLAPSTVSRHLSALAELGLADRTRRGACVFYRLSPRGEALLDLF